MPKMGSENTKFKVETMEDNLRELINRLKRNVTPVNKYVAIQLRRAVFVYARLINESKMDAISQARKDIISICIDQAFQNLEKVSTFEKCSTDDIPHDKHWQKQLETTMFCLKQVDKKLRNNRIDEGEYEDYLTLITYSSQQLDISSKLVDDDKLSKAKDEMSILFLELFIKTPTFSISDQKFLHARSVAEEGHLQQSSSLLYTETNVNMVKELLENQLQQLTFLAGKSGIDEYKLAETPSKSNISDFKEKEKSQDQHRTSNGSYMMENSKSMPPVPPKKYSVITENNESDRSASKPPVPARRKINVNRMENSYVTNEEIDEKYEDKKTAHSDNRLECQDDIRQIKRSLEQYRTEACQFAHSTKSYEYNQKKVEITSLKERTDKVPDKTLYFDKQDFSHKIAEILEMLEKRAEGNDKKEHNLQALQSIERQVDSAKTLDKSRTRTKLNECKNIVVSLNFPDEDVCAKREELIKKIQTLLDIDYLDSQLICQQANSKFRENEPSYFDKIKASLDKYKVEAQEFTYPLSSKRYQHKRDEIAGLLVNYEGILLENVTTKKEISTISYKISEILKTLQEKATHNEKIDCCLKQLEDFEKEVDDISKSTSESSKKLFLLEGCKNRIDGIDDLNDEISAEKRELLTKIENARQKEVDETLRYASVNISVLKNLKK